MRFVWDENKNRINRAKHGISFESAMFAFDDPAMLSRPDRFRGSEERLQCLGYSGNTLLAVAYTFRHHHGEEVCRIISARRATKHERNLYEEDP